MTERNKAIQEAMAIMHKDMTAMGGPARHGFG